MSSKALPDRWQHACEAVGIANAGSEHARLLRAWSSMGRHYHTVQHLTACLSELDGASMLAQSAAEVELALWFHDAIYRTHRNDNEARSAQWAARFLTEHGAAKEVVANVHDYVMATAHAAAELSGDAALVVDIDLSILGQPPAVYDEFERNVRREYWWVPKSRFAGARCGILRSFLDRPSLYHWRHFRDRYEAFARANLARAIAALQT
jgi:predicted metal-dependent HD superfamily phosphohydrolase